MEGIAYRDDGQFDEVCVEGGAHLDHRPENCERENLRAWCQRCHNTYDMSERRRGIAERAKAARATGDLFT
jgi:5-methylcytosine-specific restriction endonuclease McrA